MVISPEFELVCRAARLPQQPEDAAALRLMAASGVSWPAVMLSSRENRVTQLVLAALKSCDSPHVPAETIAALQCQSVIEAKHTLRQVAELERLLGRFAAAGIPVLVLKGAALAIQLYGNLSRRWSRDIDLYVSPNRADVILHEAGYASPRDALSPLDQATCCGTVKLFAQQGRYQLQS